MPSKNQLEEQLDLFFGRGKKELYTLYSLYYHVYVTLKLKAKARLVRVYKGTEPEL